MVEISRIEKSITKDPRFITRFFGVEEQKFLTKKEQTKQYYQTIAANFAAKEAFSKALGTGIRGFRLSEVEILRNELGAPYIKLSGKAAEIVQKLRLDFSVSQSHTDQHAIAIVVAYPIS
ncbi:holo-ACP synthase [Paludicola sp. MB14-C6]|uniref:holo-ACP synthase n=1 Tax=Paludihabitans sp. MB14-C6 TaxID=3070656 RepID=UPI0027DB8FE9|nr:holo-ACP synthase [Paludicola sp. MB14-C6]WMJ22137.1 holo-ACP synthase [Paludicola sp. MB14-C6]